MNESRTFDYVPRLVDANRPYRMGVAGDTRKARYWTPGSVVTDQGSEGACVGHGVTNEWMASPIRGRVSGIEGANGLASAVYARCKDVDEWEGSEYSGTSVRAGMLVGRERGWWRAFSWALNMSELRAALDVGPVVIGVTWLDGMYEAPGGIVTVQGRAVGGHCLLLTGYTPRHPKLKAPAYRWRNSWSTAYGVRGSAYIRADDLDRILFQAGNEAAVPMERKP